MPKERPAEIPARETRLACNMQGGPHPCVLEAGLLLEMCELRTQRRSGPGGQHRNKTSSGAFITHRSSGIVGEATERRSQAQNRAVALLRLRFSLAVELRTSSPLDPEEFTPDSNEIAYRDRYRGHSMKLSEANADKPAVLALVLNDVLVAGGQPSLVGDCWQTSTSRIVALLRSHTPSLQWVNRVRRHHQRYPLH